MCFVHDFSKFLKVGPILFVKQYKRYLHYSELFISEKKSL